MSKHTILWQHKTSSFPVGSCSQRGPGKNKPSAPLLYVDCAGSCSQCFDSESHSVVPNSLQHHVLYSPQNSPGQNTGLGSCSLLQGIFPTQGSNPGLPHCRQILYQLSHQGSSRILEWVAYPFSSGSSWPRNWTRISCSAGGFSTWWATREFSMLCW